MQRLVRSRQDLTPPARRICCNRLKLFSNGAQPYGQEASGTLKGSTGFSRSNHSSKSRRSAGKSLRENVAQIGRADRPRIEKLRTPNRIPRRGDAVLRHPDVLEPGRQAECAAAAAMRRARPLRPFEQTTSTRAIPRASSSSPKVAIVPGPKTVRTADD
jgi:hypothetical protein